MKNQTKEKIWQAFETLLMTPQTSFSDIRIGQICEASAIHRSTFYRHFEDKYQLLDYGLKKLWEDYFDLPNERRVYEPFQTAEGFYTESNGKKLINKHLGDDYFIEAVDRFFLEEMKKSVIAILPTDITLPRELLAIYAVSTIQVIEEWQKQERLSLSTKELDMYYQRLVIKTLPWDLK